MHKLYFYLAMDIGSTLMYMPRTPCKQNLILVSDITRYKTTLMHQGSHSHKYPFHGSKAPLLLTSIEILRKEAGIIVPLTKWYSLLSQNPIGGSKVEVDIR